MSETKKVEFSDPFNEALDWVSEMNRTAPAEGEIESFDAVNAAILAEFEQEMERLVSGFGAGMEYCVSGVRDFGKSTTSLEDIHECIERYRDRLGVEVALRVMRECFDRGAAKYLN